MSASDAELTRYARSGIAQGVPPKHLANFVVRQWDTTHDAPLADTRGAVEVCRRVLGEHGR